MIQAEFKTFIKGALSNGFEEFVTLYFPEPWPKRKFASEWERTRECILDWTDEKRRAVADRRFDKAQACAERWIGEVRECVGWTRTRHIMVIEDRLRERDCLFHVLLGGCDWTEYDFCDRWAPRWNEISGGKAFKGEMDERIGGLLKYFLFQKYCVVEVDCVGVQGRYSMSNFEGSKSY